MSNLLPKQILQKLETFAGREKYLRFLSALRGQAKVDNRLMQWQEQLLKDLAATTNWPIPMDLNGILDLYRLPPLTCKVGVNSDTTAFLRIEEPVVRLFRSINQYASGGSHITVFTVEICTHSDPVRIDILDRVSPEHETSVVSSLLTEIQSGARTFSKEYANTLPRFHGLRISLQDFVYHEIDLKPYKFASAMKFVLQDLHLEMSNDCRIAKKLVEIPI